RFIDAPAFYAAAEAFLLAHEAENGLMIGLARGMIHVPNLYLNPYFALVHDENLPVLACLMTPPNAPVLSYGAENEVLTAAVDALIADMRPSYPALAGVTAPTSAAAAFAAAWTRLTRQPARVKLHERLYRLDRVTPARPVSGALRPITHIDRAVMIDWLYAFEVEAFGASSREETERRFDTVIQTGVRRYFFWEDDGEIVSLSGAGGETPNGIRLGPVYTPPELRGRGYASACVAALTQQLLDEGRQFVTLFTDLANPTSNHIYQALGYQPVTDFELFTFAALTFG
ncbi:MAG: GNAT family N-acetyltransferase, partial [Chloroflexota bacterium]|nr:GNAT family N-acetyltransferase [Chloroflexota bacterium]